VLTTAAAVYLVGLGACTSVDSVTGRPVANLYTLDEDIRLGRATLQDNIRRMRKAGVRINADPVRLAQLSNIVQRIARVSDMPQLPYSVTLFHTGIVNAAAAPGGSIMVFEGLYDPEKGLVHDEDELAAVLAHEIAHVNCRHTTERLTIMLGVGALVEVAAEIAEDNDAGTLGDVLRGAFVVGGAVLVPMYSRRDEFEADRVGLFYMARAGYDPRAAVRIWKRVAAHQGKRQSVSIFATHPSDARRCRELEKLLPWAMDEYAVVKGGYPSDYEPPPGHYPGRAFDWRHLSQ